MQQIDAATVALIKAGFTNTPLVVSPTLYNALQLVYTTITAAAPQPVSITTLYQQLDSQILVQDGLTLQTVLTLLVTVQLIAYCEVLAVYYQPPQYSANFALKFTAATG